jgi:hypothetical protein
MLWRVSVAPLITCEFWITYIDLVDHDVTLVTTLSYHKYKIVVAATNDQF